MAAIGGRLHRAPGWAAVLLVGLIAGMVLVQPGSAAPPEEIPQPDTPVVEQNLDGDGYIAVHEQGTANVNVTGGSMSVGGTVSAAQSGTWTVDATQSGPWTVTVGNPAASPVSVESVQAPLREPFNANGYCRATDPNAVACDVNNVVVAPADRWLVVTQLSAWSSFFDQGRAVQVLFDSSYLDDTNTVRTLYRTFQPGYSGIPNPQGSTSTGYYHGSWNAEIYVLPGEDLDVNVSWAPSVTGSTDKLWIISVEGYMVETPSS